MDQGKIGKFLATLRKEKNLTQEELAEKLNVARRTVSRWETGFNLPDMDILIEISDFYSVGLREILDGERRTDKMEQEMKETVLKVAEYENEGKKRASIVTIVYSTIGILAIIANMVMTLSDMPDTFWTGFLKGSTLATAIVALFVGIAYVTGTMAKLFMFKTRLLKSMSKSEGR